ncbi:unnamed protein product [Rodentolepis nana]|uniref:Piezo non-specific cation channel R-Ras-binding domain-containing protein n=1 Tax=Rodentolepis nana TaxID=102285 RepID=A0A3P7SKV8_RODNA|nr:unnamed protein product [Rodentolepis nana]
MAKCSLQLMGCVYWNRLVGSRICWLIQLFGISCMNPVGWNDYVGYSSDIGCEIVSNGLHWDVVCFAVIIFQRKIFTTSSFRHVVFDLNVQSCFASRGAFLINRKLMQVISEQIIREKRDLERVQRKLDRIAQHQKDAGKNMENITEHYILIRSGDYYQFEGDPEDEEEEEEEETSTTTTSQLLLGATPSTIEGVHHQTGKELSHREMLQRNHIRAAWPNATPAQLDALANYTCPYSPAQCHPQPAAAFSGSQQAKLKPRSRFVRADTGGREPSSSSESINDATNNVGSGRSFATFRTHRRMSSYPEAFLAAKRRAKRNEQALAAAAAASTSDAGIELQALPARNVQQQSQPFTSQSQSAPKLKGHRRIASAGPMVRRGTELTPSPLPTSTEMEDVAERQEHRLKLAVNTKPTPRNALRPSVTFAASSSPDPGTIADNDGEEEEDSLMMQDADDDDDDDIDIHNHMNPLQLLNQAMEHGVRSAARQYRRRNMITHQNRVSIVADGTTGPSDDAEGAPAPAIKLSTTFLKPARPPLSKQVTLDGSQAGTGTAGIATGTVSSLNTSSVRAPYEADENDEPEQPTMSRAPLRYDYAIAVSGSGQTPCRTDSDGTLSHLSQEVMENTEADKSEGCWSRFKAGCLVLHIFLLSTIQTTTVWLNSITRVHRRIRRTIDIEKRKVKQKALYIFNRSSTGTRVTLESVVLDVISGGASPYRSAQDSNAYGGGIPGGRRNRPAQGSIEGVPELDDEFQDEVLDSSRPAQALTWEQREREFRRSRPSLFLLLIAVGNLIVVHSELVCYLVLIINHMRSANVISLVYPLMIFLWGMLSVPRPTKTFWITLITYTELVIIVKYIFQFRFIKFNSPDQVSATLARTHWLPVIFGVEKTDSYAIWDLIQLLFIFMHRSYLKNYGLWRDDTEFKEDLIKAGAANKASSKRNYGQSSNSNKKEELIVSTYSKSSSYQGSSSSSTLNPITKMRRFYLKMTDPRYNQKVDVYVYMFICEFLAFWIIIFGYQSFGPSTGMGDNAFEFIKTNRVRNWHYSSSLHWNDNYPISVYCLGSSAISEEAGFGKIHLPNFPCDIDSCLSLLHSASNYHDCIYFGLSAYQIRSGYPRHILGNFLTKNYNYLNLVLFKAYLIMPFVYEVRSVMDWMWTDSPLSLYHWMELEDIYAKVFVMKCWRRSEIEYPTPLGRKRALWVKYLVGMLILLFAFVCFWGPLVVFSFIDTTFAINVPVECSQALAVGGFPALYFFTSRENNLLHVNDSFLSEIRQCNALNQASFLSLSLSPSYCASLATTGFVSNFKTEDVSNMTFDTVSERLWTITPPMYQRLMNELADNSSQMSLTFHVTCRRTPRPIDSSATRVEQFFNRPLTQKERLEFRAVLNESLVLSSSGSTDLTSTKTVRLDLAFPRFLFAQKSNLRNPSGNLAKPYTYINVSASLEVDRFTHQRWWVMEEVGLAEAPCYGSVNNLSEADMHYRSPNRLFSIIIFNERVSDNLLGKIFSSYGIIGMYAAYIFFASRILRMIYSDISYQISLQELPHVDRLLNLCHDIYLVRENGKLNLEELLFAKLIFLYRSSETMIKWTRHPKWLIDKFTKKPEDEENNSNRKDEFGAVWQRRGSIEDSVFGVEQPQAENVVSRRRSRIVSPTSGVVRQRYPDPLSQ